MNGHKLLRSLINRLKILKTILFRVKIYLLYNDCVTIGSHFDACNIKFVLNPHFSKLILGHNTQIRESAIFRLGKNAKVTIGNGFFANTGLSVNALNNISIGNNTILGENVKLYDHNHGYKDPNVAIKDQPYTIGKIRIGNNCWIGSNVVILKDVEIGDNCIIGASCVIYKNIPSNSIIKSSQNLSFSPIEHVP